MASGSTGATPRERLRISLPQTARRTRTPAGLFFIPSSAPAPPAGEHRPAPQAPPPLLQLRPGHPRPDGHQEVAAWAGALEVPATKAPAAGTPPGVVRGWAPAAGQGRTVGVRPGEGAPPVAVQAHEEVRRRRRFSGPCRSISRWRKAQGSHSHTPQIAHRYMRLIRRRTPQGQSTRCSCAHRLLRLAEEEAELAQLLVAGAGLAVDQGGWELHRGPRSDTTRLQVAPTRWRHWPACSPRAPVSTR